MKPFSLNHFVFAGATALAIVTASAPAQAAPVITPVNIDLSGGPYTFSVLGSSFTFAQGSSFANFIAVQTAGAAAVRTVFGNPSTDFTDRGTVIYDGNTLGGFGAVPALASIPFTNGANFLGLRVTANGANYYGFAYTTDSILNSYGFESLPDTGIIATIASPAAVPEPATWAMLVLGFGVVGSAMRRRGRQGTAFA